MAQVLIVYYSRSGHTEEMAGLIAQGVREEGVETEIKRVQDTTLEDLQKADGIIMGSPTYYGVMAAELKKLIDESVKCHGKLEGKVGAAFASSGGPGGGNETTIMDILQAMLIHGMIVQGDHHGDHYGPIAVGAPDERSARECRRRGQRVAQLVKRLFASGTP